MLSNCLINKSQLGSHGIRSKKNSQVVILDIIIEISRSTQITLFFCWPNALQLSEA